MSTILSTIAQLFAEDGEREQAVFIHPSGERIALTRAELNREANKAASKISAAGIGRAHVILMLPHGPQLMSAFLGAMKAGAIPSIFPVNASRVGIERLRSEATQALSRANAQLVITDSETQRAFFADGCPTASMTPDDWGNEPSDFEDVDTHGDDVAFVQHSSGTTGQKKGVAITHRALIAQVRSYGERLHLSEKDVIASWLPVYHDMGFIACFMMPLVTGVPVIALDPFEWVSDPGSFLTAISDEGATLAWMPNFAYLLMAKRIDASEHAGDSLSSLRALINCSEPVTQAAHDCFVERFEVLGLDPSCLGACYAMAENTFAVTQTELGASLQVLRVDRDSLQYDGRAIDSVSTTHHRSLVSSGAPIVGCELRIVDDHGVALPERQVGEITLRSESMLDGYFRRPDLSELAIKDGYYWTGDLGFMAAGQLFVTGRKKDLLIVAGRNIHPEDVEAIASEVEGVRGGRTVAFADYDERAGTDSLILLAERELGGCRTDSEIRREISQHVAEGLGVTARQVLLVPNDSLLKSTSGKMSRGRCKKEWQSGRLRSTPPPAPKLVVSAEGIAAHEGVVVPEGVVTTELRTERPAMERKAFGFQHLFPVILGAELGVQLLSVAGPASLVWAASNSLWTLVPAIVAAYYLYCAGILFWSALLVRITPKPSLGQAGHRDKLLFALSAAFYLFVDRGPARWHVWISPFPAYPFLSLCGAKISPDLVIAATSNCITEPFLTEIGEGTVLGNGCLISGHWVPKADELFLGRVKIGRRVLVGKNACVWPDVQIGDDAVICQGASVMPGTVVGPGEIWGGVPARRLDGGSSKVSVHRVGTETERGSLPASLADARKLVVDVVSEIQGSGEVDADTQISLQRTGAIDSLRFLELIEELNRRTGASLVSGGDEYRTKSIEDLARDLVVGNTVGVESGDRTGPLLR